MRFDPVNMDVLVGKQFDRVAANGSLATAGGLESHADEVHFCYGRDIAYMLAHDQNCCESVYIESISGDLDDLQGTPILEAYADEQSDDDDDGDGDESHTWTFFRIITIKGTVVIRFYGSSNGYYSETADLCVAVPPVPEPDRDVESPARMIALD